MIDLLLVNPGAARQNYGALSDGLTAIEPPIWCRIIAGYVRSRGFDVAVADMEASGISPDALGILARDMRPRLAAVVAHGHQPSASTQTMVAALPTAAILESIGIPTILLGGHPSALPERTLRETSARYVCDGEGPITIEALLNRCPEDFVPGLIWRDGEKIVANERARLLDVGTSELEGEAWDLFKLRRYRAHNWQCLGAWPRSPYASIYTSFGCPYRCSFCMINVPFHSNQYRARRPERVVREIEFLYRERGVRTFKIADEMFVLKPSHYLAICEGIAKLGIGEEINIWCYARVDTIREGELDLLRRAGIRWIALGIETADETVRDGANKAIRPRDIVAVVRSIQDHSISVIGNYIFGLPGDNRETMQATLDLAMECRTEFANFYCAQAYPGSALYEKTVAEGRTLPESWSGYSQHSYDSRPLDTEYVSAREVLRFRDGAFQAYYTDDSYLRMLELKFGTEAVREVKAITARPLARKLLEDAA